MLRLKNISRLEDKDTEKVVSFYRAAKEYCNFINNHSGIVYRDVSDWMVLLMNLYIHALEMSDLKIEAKDEVSSYVSMYEKIPSDELVPPKYWVVFNPLECEEPVCGHLGDDVTDIARDLSNGIEEYEAGNIDKAIFVWLNMLDVHWGKHTVDALKTLHELRIRELMAGNDEGE